MEESAPQRNTRRRAWPWKNSVAPRMGDSYGSTMSKGIQSGGTGAGPMGRGLRLFLYTTAAVTGGAILIIEILGAKLLAPFLGTSHFVWTAQISVTLLSLAAGYALGGWMSDRGARLDRLYGAIALAGVYLALVLVVFRQVATAALGWSLPVASALASAALFFVPLTLLATTGPFLVRVLASSFNTVGGQVGRLSAVGTVGSVAGAALTGYVLIPLLSNTATLLILSAGLLAFSGLYWIGWRRGGVRLGGVGVIAAGLAFPLLSSVADPYRQEGDLVELHRGNSNFGLIQVLESKDGRRRYYLNDFLFQNTYDPVAKQSLSLFTYMLKALGPSYGLRPKSALCVGLGVGVVPGALAAEGVEVDVVEINPDVVPVAEKYFDLEPSKMRLHLTDGRHFLNVAKGRYDLVVLDAFLGDSSPAHLMSREAFALMSARMSEDGLLVINSFGDLEPGSDYFTQALNATLRAVFPFVRIHLVGNGNVFFVAGKQARDQVRGWKSRELERAPAALMGDILGCLAAGRELPANGVVLRDDFNPAEFHDAKNRETYRRSLARWALQH